MKYVVYKYIDDCRFSVYFVGNKEECRDWIANKLAENYDDYLEEAIEETFASINTIYNDESKERKEELINFGIYEGVSNAYGYISEYKIVKVVEDA